MLPEYASFRLDVGGDWQAWLERVRSLHLETWVDDSRQEGRMFMTYTTFRVSLRFGTADFSVRRRYSDFAWLRELLEAKFTGMILPPLPEKKSIGNKNATFVASRMRGLQLFLQRLVSIPFVCSDGLLWAFATSEKSAWEAQRKLRPRDFGLEASSSAPPRPSSTRELCGPDSPASPIPFEGAVRWQEFVMSAPLPDKPDLLLSNALRHVQELCRVLRQLSASGQRLVDRAAALATEGRAFQDAFKQVHAAETAESDHHHRRSVWQASTAEPMQELLRVGAHGFSATASLWEKQRMVLESLMVDFLRFEDAQVHVVRDLLLQFEQMRRTQGKASQNVARSRGRSETSGSDDRKRGDASDTVSAAEAQWMQAEFAGDFLARALLSTELERWCIERLETTQLMFRVLGAGNEALTRRMGSLWETFLYQGIPEAVRGDATGHGREEKRSRATAKQIINSVEAVLAPESAASAAAAAGGGGAAAEEPTK